VYSRITGYYRPVQNWNDGKSQEYRDRKVYDIDRSKLKRASCETPAEEKTEAVSEAAIADGAYLFTTATCPNCKIAKSVLDRAGYLYHTLLANENAELVNEFGIKQAPTLVVVKGGVAEKFAGVSDIKKMLGA
jgi:ribonucleoside-triphosphate reductase